MLGFTEVVELLGNAIAKLVDQGLDLQAGDPRCEELAEPRHLIEICAKGAISPGVLDLDRHGPSVVPDRAVHLPDGCRRGRLIVEG